ncbi:MAG: putative zinc-binding metallopeptidase [Pseudomonadota bacterium]
MRLFACGSCGQTLYYENTRCERCGHELGFATADLALSALRPDGSVWWRLDAPEGRYRRCANTWAIGCNWLVDVDAWPGSDFCDSCALTQMKPDQSVAGNGERWEQLERAKRRLLYGVRRLGLDLTPRSVDPGAGLAFEFLADVPGQQPIRTGHANGVITVNIAEADAVESTRQRELMDELYRTPLGHFRHEIGHYYWDRLVLPTPSLERFRALFGDERADYGAAMERHYLQGPPGDWSERVVSAYASMHPWEDWAETFAHYLHIVDTLETAASFGLSVDPALGTAPAVDKAELVDACRAPSAAALVDAWLPLTFAMNSLNRAMGLPDLYPFVLSPPVVAKLELVHQVIAEARGG